MDIAAIASDSQSRVDSGGRTNELGADDFLQLLVMQLMNQDPLSPTSNADLLQQLSTIRDIQLSSTLVDSLKTLTGTQRYGSAASLIGKMVSGRVGDESTGFETVSGLVVGVRFDAGGNVSLELDSGRQLPLEQLESVSGVEGAVDSLIGRSVRGVDRSGDEPESIEGIVTGIGRDQNDDPVLELDTGEQLRLSDLVRG